MITDKNMTNVSRSIFLALFRSGRCSADDPSTSALFDHLFRRVLVAQEDSATIDSKHTIPFFDRR